MKLRGLRLKRHRREKRLQRKDYLEQVGQLLAGNIQKISPPIRRCSRCNFILNKTCQCRNQSFWVQKILDCQENNWRSQLDASQVRFFVAHMFRASKIDARKSVIKKRDSKKFRRKLYEQEKRVKDDEILQDMCRDVEKVEAAT